MANNVQKEAQRADTELMDVANDEGRTHELTNDEKVEKEAPSSASKSSKAKQVTTKRAVSLPLARIKQIMKMDPEVHMASSESVFLIAKCAEVFVSLLTKEAFSYTTSSKKKTVQKRDVQSAINNLEQLAFLDSALD